jgi:hypothetical protein
VVTTTTQASTAFSQTNARCSDPFTLLRKDFHISLQLLWRQRHFLLWRELKFSDVYMHSWTRTSASVRFECAAGQAAMKRGCELIQILFIQSGARMEISLREKRFGVGFGAWQREWTAYWSRQKNGALRTVERCSLSHQMINRIWKFWKIMIDSTSCY